MGGCDLKVEAIYRDIFLYQHCISKLTCLRTGVTDLKTTWCSPATFLHN